MLNVDCAVRGQGEEVVAEPPVRFAGVLRRLRVGARLTQEELAEAAGLSWRAVSNRERGMVTTPHKDTVRLLAEALGLEAALAIFQRLGARKDTERVEHTLAAL